MRVAVLSDIHSNIVALDAVLLHAAEVDAIWHLGDVVGYGPEPDAVVARLSERDATGVRGNHDAAAIGGREIDWFNPEARAAAEWTRDTMSSASRAWLADLPERLTIGDITLVHGSPRDPLREYITDSEVAAANLDVLQTHARPARPYPCAGRLDRDAGWGHARSGPGHDGARARHVSNAAQPRQRRSAARWRPAGGLPAARPRGRTRAWHRVVYDIGPVQAGIRAAGLPARLAARLAIGA